MIFSMSNRSGGAPGAGAGCHVRAPDCRAAGVPASAAAGVQRRGGLEGWLGPERGRPFGCLTWRCFLLTLLVVA